MRLYGFATRMFTGLGEGLAVAAALDDAAGTDAGEPQATMSSAVASATAPTLAFEELFRRTPCSVRTRPAAAQAVASSPPHLYGAFLV